MQTATLVIWTSNEHHFTPENKIKRRNFKFLEFSKTAPAIKHWPTPTKNAQRLDQDTSTGTTKKKKKGKTADINEDYI